MIKHRQLCSKMCRQKFVLLVHLVTILNTFVHVWVHAHVIACLSWKCLSLALHVSMKLVKSFEPIQNCFGVHHIEFSLFWGFHNIGQSLAMPIGMCFYVNNYLPWIPVGMKIGKSIVFEVENQKMKVKTLKKIRFWLKYGSYHKEK